MAYPISQYVRNHSVTVAVANWGIAQTHLHDLNDGSAPTAPGSVGYTPNVVYVNSAYVTIGATNYAINAKTVSITAVGATTISFIVGPANTTLRDALTKVFGVVPTSLTFEVVTRFAHSMEIGTTATGDETIGVLAAGLIPIELTTLSPSSTMDVIYVRTDGADTNTGRVDSAAGAYFSIQRACNDIMAMSPLYHDVLVRIGAGIHAGFTLDGVECRNGASVYFVGNPPATPIANGTSTSAGGAAFVVNGHTCTLQRLTPDAAFPAALGVASIGRTLRISNGVFVAYATIGQLATGVLPANQVIDLVMDPLLAPMPPPWVTNAGTTYQVINEQAADVTFVTGNIVINNVKKTQGATGQGTGNQLAKHNLLGHIRCSTPAVLEGSDRFAFHGCWFEAGLTLTGCRDCTSATNSVWGLGPARYWPDAVWTALGYSNGAGGTIAGTANAYGGCGFYVASAAGLAIQTCDGTIQGVVMNATRPVTVGANSDILISGASVDSVVVQLRGAVGFNYTRFAGRLSTDTDGKFIIGDYNTWMARGAATPDTLANSPVNLNTGMLAIAGSGKGFITLDDPARLEGHNSAGAAANTGNVVIIVASGGTLYATGGHSLDFWGEGGWLYMTDCATGYMSGDREMAAKGVATTAYPDFHVRCASDLRSIGAFVHANADNIPGSLTTVDWGSTWVHGDVAGDTGVYTIGDGIGGGIACGAGPAVVVNHGSKLVIGAPRVHNTTAAGGACALAILRRSEGYFGTTGAGNSAYFDATGGGAFGDLQLGVHAAIALANPLAAMIHSDLPAVVGGTEHLCYFNVE